MSSIRFGFLRALAENGVSLEEFDAYLCKKAAALELTKKSADSILSGPTASFGNILLQTALIPAALSIGGGMLTRGGDNLPLGNTGGYHSWRVYFSVMW